MAGPVETKPATAFCIPQFQVGQTAEAATAELGTVVFCCLGHSFASAAQVAEGLPGQTVALVVLLAATDRVAAVAGMAQQRPVTVETAVMV